MCLMAWYLCTISSGAKKNWDLCKDSKTWGILTLGGYASKDRARRDDNLLFWLGGRGYVGHAKVIENTRPPLSPKEVPWLGGQERYGLVIPLEEVKEFSTPTMLKFVNRRQEITGIDQSFFQRGYMPITDSIANKILDLNSQ